MMLLFLLVVGVCAILLAHAGYKQEKEGFKAGQPGIRCGVDLPSCARNTFCINGFCGLVDIPPLPENELPVYP